MIYGSGITDYVLNDDDVCVMECYCANGTPPDPDDYDCEPDLQVCDSCDDGFNNPWGGEDICTPYNDAGNLQTESHLWDYQMTSHHLGVTPEGMDSHIFIYACYKVAH